MDGTTGDEIWLEAFLARIAREMDRVVWNVTQKEFANPFENSGNVEGFKNDVFEVHAYDWGDEPEFDYNFKWKDFEVSWYKYMGRGMWTNRPMGVIEGVTMLEECIQSLLKYEEENDR